MNAQEILKRVRDTLLQNIGIVTAVDDRVTIEYAEQGEVFPGIVLSLVSATSEEVLNGDSGLTAVRVEVSVFSRESYVEAFNLADLITDTLTVYPSLNGIAAEVRRDNQRTGSQIDGDKVTRIVQTDFIFYS